jgi:hypothetical protein
MREQLKPAGDGRDVNPWVRALTYLHAGDVKCIPPCGRALLPAPWQPGDEPMEVDDQTMLRGKLLPIRHGSGRLPSAR